MSKFDKIIPKGSVPNCQLQIANRYDNRWFKCKVSCQGCGGVFSIYLLLQLILSYVANILSGYIMKNPQKCFKQQNNVVLALCDQPQTFSITLIHGNPLLVTASMTSPGLFIRKSAAIADASACFSSLVLNTLLRVSR